MSQGHSDAIRRVEGVLDAKQYTIPVEEALERVRNGEMPEFSTRQKHLRECFVVAEDGADLSRIEKDIKTMPDYFSDYNTIVHFISKEELDRNHNKISHGGLVIQSGRTGLNYENTSIIEYSLRLDSNQVYCQCIIGLCKKAAYRLNKEADLELRQF